MVRLRRPRRKKRPGAKEKFLEGEAKTGGGDGKHRGYAMVAKKVEHLDL